MNTPEVANRASRKGCPKLRFLAEWRPEGCNLACDDRIDIESAAISAVHCLEVSTEWVLDAPASILDPAILGEVSLTCWKLFIASLHIP